MKTRVPDIYIIGAQKSGTTTLYDWLAQHPEIYAHPFGKDYPYFSNDRTHDDGAEIFHSFFAGNNGGDLVLGGDANAMFSPSGPQRMHYMMPHAHLIAILRDPVERAYSAYCHAVERLMESRTFEQAVYEELEGAVYEHEDALRRDYLAHGQYARQLKNVHKHFSSENVKVVIFEELKQDPLSAFHDICQFLGIPMDFSLQMESKNQTKGGYRSRLLAKLAYGHPTSMLVRGIGRAIIPYSTRTFIRRKLSEFNRAECSKPEFPCHVRELLRDFYASHVAELESLIGREIELWRRR